MNIDASTDLRLHAVQLCETSRFRSIFGGLRVWDGRKEGCCLMDCGEGAVRGLGFGVVCVQREMDECNCVCLR